MVLEALETTLRARHDVVIGVGVDETAVADAERALGIKFPPALREYLMRFGHLELGHFELFGLGEGIADYLNLVNMAISERSEPGNPIRKDLIPILNDGGGNLYCIGTSEQMAGRIYFWDHALGQQPAGDEHASSLPDWVAELLRELDGEHG